MRRPRPALRPACLAALAVLTAQLWTGGSPADADSTDGTLTVLVSRDSDFSGGYDPEIDRPQPGITITVTDPGGHVVSGTTDAAGEVVVKPGEELTGGRYVVSAEIPAGLDLGAVVGSKTFAPPSSTVDVTSEDQTVRLGVAQAEPERTAVTADPPPAPSAATSAAAAAPPAEPRFAVGGRVWSDLDRDGRQDPDEPAAPRTSVQLLEAGGTWWPRPPRAAARAATASTTSRPGCTPSASPASPRAPG